VQGLQKILKLQSGRNVVSRILNNLHKRLLFPIGMLIQNNYNIVQMLRSNVEVKKVKL